MNEQEPRTPEIRPAADRASPDWRRLDVALGRFGELISAGINEARQEHREISPETARCIAHVLGRALGRSSRLAGFGRTGEGTYEDLRDEYLDLYGSNETDSVTKELIDWLGTYLVERENIGSGRQYMNEHLRPKLDRLLVRTEIRVHDQPFTVHLPASLDAAQVAGISEELTNLRLDEDEALQAYLSLPDVDANTEMLMESFHENYVQTYVFLEDAVRDLAELDELERTICEVAESRALPVSAIEIDYALVAEHVREAYDLVEWKAHVHVFYK
ncbi:MULTISPECIES: hypothetical protein [unclassified Microbacterium]|uniref:hypothetical protein n=1 Tax=unclassified Microbacterium TaxID=2609290 RepID=UPI003663751C